MFGESKYNDHYDVYHDYAVLGRQEERRREERRGEKGEGKEVEGMGGEREGEGKGSQRVL